MRKFLIAMMCIIMVVCFMPTVAMAGELANCPSGDNCTDHAAAIGTTHYDTLQEAVNAAPTDGTETTIKMVTNETKDSGNLVSIDGGRNIVLDLNGKTIRTTGRYGSNNAILVKNSTLTVEDNSQDSSGMVESTYGSAVNANKNSNVTLEGGLFQVLIVIQSIFILRPC